VLERIPAYVTRCVMDEKLNRLCGQIWDPPEPFRWTDGKFYGKKRREAPFIYEAHIGMAQEHGGVGTYREFADNNLDWIRWLGYNTLQLMAIQEHPYYASFGYQVTNFFAPTHRYGTPEDLKYLINKAHHMGISVLLDIVHSHACPNPGEGLNQLDGTDDQYFLPGDRGWHPNWKTRIFDYSKHDVIHFLLSNLKYWQEVFHFDGFRFDGVTSMMYENHGNGSFNGYDSYFSMNTNVDGRVYLMLANELIHGINPKAMTVAEDVSAFPGMCLPLEYAGIGFDYRLAMGIPDTWIKLVKDQRQEDWNMHALWHELTWGRPGEMSIGYAESHDQALVGDKSLMFRMADAEMYTGMMKEYHSLTMDRAIELHKIIRLYTMSLGGNGYLNFMGNEFGHPEWIDFPRAENGWSYHHARRQWSLRDDPSLRFKALGDWDAAMLNGLAGTPCVSAPPIPLVRNDADHVLAFYRGGFVFVFNFDPSRSYSDYGVLVPPGGTYRLLFDSDETRFGGQGRIAAGQEFWPANVEMGDEIVQQIKLYLPARTALVLKRTV
jgi:1,4-alpha-glucan branching enzyme